MCTGYGYDFINIHNHLTYDKYLFKMLDVLLEKT